jgi:hypothetical protein
MVVVVVIGCSNGFTGATVVGVLVGAEGATVVGVVGTVVVVTVGVVVAQEANPIARMAINARSDFRALDIHPPAILFYP